MEINRELGLYMYIPKKRNGYHWWWLQFVETREAGITMAEDLYLRGNYPNRWCVTSMSAVTDAGWRIQKDLPVDGFLIEITPELLVRKLSHVV